MMSSPKSYKDCTYSAFVSYAHQDDKLCYGWVNHFCDELSEGLGARLRGQDIHELHLSGKNGPIKGVLTKELKERISSSFAMIIVVHENYTHSDWCLEELSYFKDTFGNEGFRDRLYILALSEKWIRSVEKTESWKQLLPYKGQIWKRFYSDDNKNMPPPVYEGKKMISPAFIELFDPFVNDLAKEIKKDLESPMKSTPRLPGPSHSISPQMSRTSSTDHDELVLYIESNQNQRNLWEPLGEQIKSKWDEIIAKMGQKETPQLQFSFQALPIDQIDQYPTLEDAAGVILLWGGIPPQTLIAHIRKVERRLYNTHDRTPRIVAYLIPPQLNPNKPMPAWGWSVLRFDAEPEDKIAVVHDESADLEKFLLKIFKHTTRRRAQVTVSSNSIPML
jgi:TIR domain